MVQKKSKNTALKLLAAKKSWVIGGFVAIILGFGGYYLYGTLQESSALYVSGWGCHSTPTLSEGSRGACVKYVQSSISYKYLRCTSGSITVDGSFGPKTKAAVKKFQSAYGLSSDGVVGAKTWAAIVNAPAKCTSK